MFSKNAKARVRKLAVLALVLMVAVQPAVGAVAASPDGDGTECFVRSFVQMTMGEGALESCQTPSDDMGQSHSDAYSSALAAADRGEVFRTLSSNEIQAAERSVWCRAKGEAVEEFANGTAEQDIRTEVNATIDNRTAVIQKNYIAHWNSTANQIAYTFETFSDANLAGSESHSTGNSTVDSNVAVMFRGNKEAYATGQPSGGDDIYNRTVVLANGENASYRVLGDGRPPWSPANNDFWRLDPIKGHDRTDYKASEFPAYDGSTALDARQTRTDIYVVWPGGFLDSSAGSQSPEDGKSKYVVQQTEMQDTWNETEDMNARMKANVNELVSGLFNDYDQANFSSQDAADIHSACSLSFLSTDRQSTGYYSYARAQFSLSPIDGSLNSSMQVVYEPSSGEAHPGRTDKTLEVDGTLVQPETFGPNAVLAGSDVLRYEVTNATVDDVEIVLDNGTATETLAATEVGNSTWRATSPTTEDGQNPFGNNESVEVTLRLNESGYQKEVVYNTTWAPNGGARIEMAGSLFTDWEPTATSGAFETGVWYDTSNANEVVRFLEARSDGTSIPQELDGQFRIDSMTNVRTGNSTNSTTLADDNTELANVQYNATQLNQLLEWRDTYSQNYAHTDSGGGGGWLPDFDFGLATMGFFGILIVGFVVAFKGFMD